MIHINICRVTASKRESSMYYIPIYMIHSFALDTRGVNAAMTHTAPKSIDTNCLTLTYLTLSDVQNFIHAFVL